MWRKPYSAADQALSATKGSVSLPLATGTVHTTIPSTPHWQGNVPISGHLREGVCGGGGEMVGLGEGVECGAVDGGG